LDCRASAERWRRASSEHLEDRRRELGRQAAAAAPRTCNSDILITETETETKTRMIDFSFTDTKTNTEKILKTETI